MLQTTPRWPEVYPETQYSWIDEQFAQGTVGRQEIWRHLMGVYYLPLVAYCRRRFNWAGEPEDLVGGFLEHRLTQTDYLARWRGSGVPLRKWLLGGLRLHVADATKRRDVAEVTASPGDGAVIDEDDATKLYERALVKGLVAAALDQASAACRELGLEGHWIVFERHAVDGQAYATIAAEFGIGEKVVAGMGRTARDRFRAALRHLLVRDGVAANDVSRAVEDLHAAFE